ncbi:hypothetical protein IF188_16035 [Microbacterium sp. NEAU-LLC]|uniref:DUF916 domain-containing protein n=1 Tax=Microbacterium helvum TaxID=2773713 RepID=A0ABR8NRC5_9MICO|nr:hypothetical protein [Microbacterium helvum]MBD3943204.1 hypothetical protein [Microbacterium helvum]
MNVHPLLSRTVATAALTLTLAIGAVAYPATAEESGEGGPTTTWSLSPASAEGPDARISLRHVIDPGGSAPDFVSLTNFSPHPASFDVYASDGIVTDDGDFDLLPPGEPPVDGGSWISVGTVEGGFVADGVLTIELQPGASVVVPVTVSVPENATPGDHPAGIVAQYKPAAGGSVQFASRVGVRAHLRVAGDVVAALEPTVVSSSYEPSWNPFAPGRLRVEYRLDNVGNVRLGAEAAARATGPFGLAPVRASTTTREVLPAQTSTSTIELAVWPTVVSLGAVAVTPSAVGDDDVPVLTPSSADFTAWTMPWAQLALLALAAGVVVAIVWTRRRSKAGVQRRIDEAVARAREESVTVAPQEARSTSAQPVAAESNDG